MPFDHLLKLIRNGEPVSPGTPNRPLGQLDQNTRYLLELIDAAGLGSTVFARRVTVEAEAAVGMPVYYVSAPARFERGLAATSLDPANGVVRTADSSQVMGLVFFKHSATLADLLLYGWAEVDLTAATGGDPHDGVYYLSGVTPGVLARQKPPVSVAVCRKAGSKVFVNPQFVDFLDRHTHHRFALYTFPAGDHVPPPVGGRHVITNPDPALPGWLPADHASFNGLAPVGALFGYNFAAHPALHDAWPPLPASLVSLDWNKGEDANLGGQEVPLGPSGLCVVDRYGIWWLSDCYGDVPWPKDYDSAVGLSISETIGECPRLLFMELILWFTKVSFATDAAVVTSLRSLDPRLTVQCEDGSPGSAGPLTIDLDLSVSVRPELVRGAIVLKEFDGDFFRQGPVAEGLYAVGDNVTLVSNRATIPLDPLNPASTPVHQGLVGVAVTQQPTLELGPVKVRLDGVGEETYQDVLYLGFPAAEETSFRGRLDVPADTQLPAPVLAIRLRLIGRAAGAMPDLLVTARRVPRPAAGLAVPLDLPLSAAEFPVTITTATTLTAANQYVEAESAAFAVAAGDTVYYTVQRSAGDAYPAELGVLAHHGVLRAGA